MLLRLFVAISLSGVILAISSTSALTSRAAMVACLVAVSAVTGICLLVDRQSSFNALVSSVCALAGVAYGTRVELAHPHIVPKLDSALYSAIFGWFAGVVIVRVIRDFSSSDEVHQES